MAPFPTLVHPFNSNTANLCAYESGNSSSKNAFVLIGGLGDGPHTIKAARGLSKALEGAPELNYSLFEIRMQSSFESFGHLSLQEDVQNISALVKYLKNIGREKIVLLGHSTGCQDLMEYNKRSDQTSSVDGFILQGPVSDRESIRHIIMQPEEESRYEEALEYARTKISEGRQLEWMPRYLIPLRFQKIPFTVYRFNSLADKGGDDDYFSSDLPNTTIQPFWSQLTAPTLVLHSGSDEFVPNFVDKEALIQKWKEIGPHVSPLSGVIPGAGHTVAEAEPQKWYCDRVIVFLRTLE